MSPGRQRYALTIWQVKSLVGIAVVGGDNLPGEDGLKEVEVVGEPGYQFNWKPVMLEESFESELVLQRIFGYGMQESKADF